MGSTPNPAESFFTPLTAFSKLNKASDTFQEWFLRVFVHRLNTVAVQILSFDSKKRPFARLKNASQRFRGVGRRTPCRRW